MWATSSVGMAIGAGMYWIGFLEALILVLMQIVLHRHPVGNDALIVQEVKIKLIDDTHLSRTLEQLKGFHKGEIIQCDISRDASGTRAKLTIRATEPIHYEETVQLLSVDKNIKEISV